MLYVLNYIENSSLYSAIVAGLTVAVIVAFARCLRRLMVGKESSGPYLGINYKDKKDDRVINNVVGSRNVINQITNYGEIHDKTSNQANDSDESFESIAAEKVIAQRLRDVIDLLNEGTRNDINAIWIAREVFKDEGFDTVQSYLNAEALQTFSFLENFSKFFGINSEWLIHGKGKPFSLEHTSSSGACISMIEEANPEAIYFVLDKSERKRAILVLQISQYSYQMLGRADWPLAIYDLQGNRNVGAGGLRGILEFYKIVIFSYKRYDKSMLDSSIRLNQISSIELKEKDWNLLLSGKKYPGAVMRDGMRSKISYWADDLRDLNWRYCGGKEQYRSLYGDWFIDAQDYIKSRVKSD